MRQPSALGETSEAPVARIGVRLMMAAIILLPASTGRATPSTISHKTPISTAAPIGLWRTPGRQACAPGIASWSTSCRITTGSRFGLIESRSPGSSMVKNDRAPSRLSIGANAVASDKYDVLGPLYSEIGGAKIGRASWRERVGQYESSPEGGVAIKKK